MILRILILVVAVGAFVVGNVVLGIMGKWTQDLPSTRDLRAYEPPVMTRIHAGDGTLVKEYAYQHRVFVPEEEIPDSLIHAFISAEDKTFFEHEGIDLKGLLRATLGNVLRGRRMAGGSTITQQVVKNMLVGDERSGKRKIREAFVANRLEKVFEKRDILELYLNEIYLGGRYYGVGSAALNYFGKSLKELTLAEAALLGAMPQAPGKVNPYQKPDAAKARRDWVLSRMHVNGYISQDEMEEAQAAPLTTVERLNSDEVRAAGYFVEEVRREILRRAEDGEIDGVESEDPRIKAKFESATLKINDLYSNRSDMVDFLRELSSRSLIRADELEEFLGQRFSCEAQEISASKCGQYHFKSLVDMDRPQDVVPLDMVMNWRERLRNYRLLYENGMSVRSTLDSRYQLAAQRSLQMGLETYDRRKGFRGPVARIDLGEGWQERLEEIGAPSAMRDWLPAVVVTATNDAVAVALADGERVSLGEESVEWTRRHKNKDTGKNGLAKGDVIYVTHELPPNVLVRTIKDDVTPKERDPWHVRQLPDVQGALVAMDPHTGRVLAMAGGYSFQTNQFNRAVQAMRQPGSSFKPFVYAAALDSGWTPADTVLDAPFVLETPQGLWKPANYSAGRYYGNSTLRLGLEKSRNLMTARLAQDVGMDRIAEYGRRFGIYPSPTDDMTEAQKQAMLGRQTYLSRSLGAGETTPLKMATAYSMLVNGGKHIDPVILDRIQDRRGHTILQRDDRPCDECNAAWKDQPPPVLPDNRAQIIDPITAYQSVSMLEGVVQRGTASRVKAVGKHLAGKTGTTNDYVDAWFVGFSPDLVAAVWIGKDMAVSLGEGESGGRVAAPIFRDFMMEALEDAPDLEFRRPAGVRLVEIDAKTGQLPGPGTTQIIEEAFKPGTEPGSRTTSQDGSNLEDYFEQLKRQREMQIDPQTGQPDYEGGGTVTPQPQEQSNDGDVDPDSGDPTDSEALPGFPGGRPATGRPGGLPTPSPYPTSEPTPDQSLDYGLQ